VKLKQIAANSKNEEQARRNIALALREMRNKIPEDMKE